MSEKIAVIGLGNILRKDDAIGIRILEILKDTVKDDGISFYDYGIASFGLLTKLSDFKRALLIDAIDAGLEPGELRIFKLEEATFRIKEKKISSHELSLSDIFELCKNFGLTTELFVAGIQINDVSYSTEMTDVLERKKTIIAKEIEEFIKRMV